MASVVKKKMGRPRLELSDKTFDISIQLPMIKSDVAMLMQCSEDTLDRYCLKRFKKTFAVVQEENRQHFRKNILGKQYEMAMKGNVALLIWLGKNYLGQKDKLEEINENEARIERDVVEKLRTIPREIVLQITKKIEVED